LNDKKNHFMPLLVLSPTAIPQVLILRRCYAIVGVITNNNSPTPHSHRCWCQAVVGAVTNHNLPGPTGIATPYF
jgi:hypothetical protein